MKKRIISLLLALLLVASAVPAPSVWAADSGETSAEVFNNPFHDGVGIAIDGQTYYSSSYRIPSMVTLSDGTIVAAADIRWNTTYDGGGLDTLVARSTDGGASWTYTLANYLGDNGNQYNAQSTAFIDPSLLVNGDTVYMLVDLYPYGISLNGLYVNGYAQFSNPEADTGFDANGNLKLSNNDHTSYDYYLKDGKIYNSANEVVEGYAVDAYFNITGADGTDSNLFYSDSPFKVARTQFLYLTKSTDGGATWSEPELLDVRATENRVAAIENALLVAPGNAITTSGGVMVYPAYSYTSSAQYVSLIYSVDGVNWERTENYTGLNFTSEGSIVELENGDLRVFVRNKTGYLCYVDFDVDTMTWIGHTETTVPTNSNTQLSAISYSEKLDGKQVILVSCPSGPTGQNGTSDNDGSMRTNGKIHVFTVEDDGKLALVKSVSANGYTATDKLSGSDYTEENGFFAYSALTERADGSIALLYENNQFGWGAGSGKRYTITGKSFAADELGLPKPGPTPTDPTDPTDPDVPPVEGGVAGVVTDANGEPVKGADGQPLVVTVQGDLPEGAVVSASVPDIEGLGEGAGIFDIKVLVPNAEGEMVEWQPIDEGKTVTVTIPVDTDAEYVDVYHFIDYVDDINGDEEIVSVEGFDAVNIDILRSAIDSYGDGKHVAVEVTEIIPVVSKYISIITDSFSIYEWTGSEFTGLSTNSDGSVTVTFTNIFSNDQTFPYYATPGQVFNLKTRTFVSGGPNAQDPYFFDADKTTYVGDVVITQAKESGILPSRQCSIVIPADANPGDVITVYFEGSSARGDFVVTVVRDVTVKFDANGKDGVTVPEDRTELTDGDPNKHIFEFGADDVPQYDSSLGYEFVGWNTSPAGNGTMIEYDPKTGKFAEGAYYSPSILQTTLYAIWKAEEYTVTLDPNGGSGEVKTETIAHGEYFTFPEDPVRPGYEFLGWSASEDGFGKRYKEGETMEVVSNAYMKAVWGVRLTVTAEGGSLYVWQEGVSGTLPIESVSEFNKQADGSYSAVIMEGFYKGTKIIFEADSSIGEPKFTTRYTGTEPAFSRSGRVVTATFSNDTGLTMESTLYFGAFEDLYHVITFDVRNGTPVAAKSVINNGSLTTLPVTTKAGYKFEYWEDVNGNRVSELTNVTASITLYAHWSPKNHTATFVDGETVVGTVGFNTDEALTLVTPEKDGYDLQGWKVIGATASDPDDKWNWVIGTVYKGTNVPSGMYGNVTLEAQWTALYSYKLIFDDNVNEDSVKNMPPELTQDWGNDQSKTFNWTEEPTRANYKFLGWSTDKNATTGDKSKSYTITGEAGNEASVTLYAIWELDVADLTISVSGTLEDQNFVFVVKDSAGKEVTSVVLYAEKTSVTVVGLTVGEYTVTPVDGWAWRQALGAQTIMVDGDGDSVTFSWSSVDQFIYWLNGYSYNGKGD